MFNSPVFTGIPTAPTADADDNSGQLANTEFVNRQIANGIAEMCIRDSYYTGSGIPFTPLNIIYIPLMGIANWLGAMVGYDKVKQAIEQLH